MTPHTLLVICIGHDQPAPRRQDVEAAVAGRRFTFSLLVHSDSTSPMIDFSAKSSILQVRTCAYDARACAAARVYLAAAGYGQLQGSSSTQRSDISTHSHV